MLDFSTYQKWAEVYQVETTVEVIVSMQGEPQAIRIEAIRSLRTGRYSTRVYCQQHATLPAAAPPVDEEAHEQPVEKPSEPPVAAQLWVDLQPTLHPTNEATADAAIERALGFLALHCD